MDNIWDTTVRVDVMAGCEGLDETIEKVRQLHRLLEEASALIDELASKELRVTITT